MLVERITSRQNPLVKRFRRVRTGGEHHLILLEGLRLVEEAVNANAHFESVAFRPTVERSERGAALLEKLEHVSCRGALVSPQVMEAISDVDSSQGIAALIARPHFELDAVFRGDRQLVVIVDELQDPGNLGSIIRTAEAAGADGVVATRNTVDPYGTKALRASMGSALRLPVATGVAVSLLSDIRREFKVRILAARTQTSGEPDSHDLSYTEVDLTQSVALLLGREGSGIPETTTPAIDQFIHIPMLEGVQSLNVASAAAILLYEAARQRGFAFSRRPVTPE